MNRQAPAVAVAAGVALGLALAGDRPLHPVAVPVVAGLCVAYLIVASPRRVPRIPFAPAFTVLGVGLGVSVIAAGDLPVTLVAAWVTFALVAAVAADVAARPGGAAVLLACGATALGVVTAVALGAWLTGLRELQPFTIDSRGRLTWPFSHPNHLAAFCAVLLPVSLAAALGTRGRPARVAAWCAPALGAAALAASLSRTSWIAAVVGVAVVAAYGPGRRLVAIGLPLAAVAASPLIVARFTAADAGGDNVRFDIWGDALRMIAADPLTGVGLGRFSQEADPLPSMPGAPRPEHAHDLVLDVAAEAGLVAAAALLAILVLALIGAHRAARGPAPDVRLAGAGIAGGLAAMLVVGALDQPFDDLRAAVACWFVIGAAAGLARATRSPAGSREPATPSGRRRPPVADPGAA